MVRGRTFRQWFLRRCLQGQVRAQDLRREDGVSERRAQEPARGYQEGVQERGCLDGRTEIQQYGPGKNGREEVSELYNELTKPVSASFLADTRGNHSPDRARHFDGVLCGRQPEGLPR